MTPRIVGLYLAFPAGAADGGASSPQARAQTMLRTLVYLLLALGAAGGGACAPNGAMPEADGTSPLVSTLQVKTLPDSVHFVLQVTNTAEDTVTLTFPSGQSFDFVVLDEGREVWRWSADRMFTQAIRTEALAPGETRSYEAAWTPPAGLSGELVARARLTAREHRAEQQARFRLP